jgi:hypothetical protein
MKSHRTRLAEQVVSTADEKCLTFPPEISRPLDMNKHTHENNIKMALKILLWIEFSSHDRAYWWELVKTVNRSQGISWLVEVL